MAAACASPAIPVTVLSGFLGSGKTTLLKHLLCGDHGLRVGVIVNDMADLNVDASALAAVAHAPEKLVSMQNGCICCTLREDLLVEVAKLARAGNLDAIVIESSGISEPQLVAETFEFEDADGSRLNDIARLDTAVTVVDASSFPKQWDSLETLADRSWGIDSADERSVAALLQQQIEFADVLVVNKTDLVPESDTVRVEHLVRALNPSATIHRSTHSIVPLKHVLRTGLFDLARARSRAGWMAEMRGEHRPETEEYGISSLVYRAQRPFDPLRLCALLASGAFTSELLVAQTTAAHPGAAAAAAAEVSDDELSSSMQVVSVDVLRTFDSPLLLAIAGRCGRIIRSKGLAWVAGPEPGPGAAAVSWSHSARVVELLPSIPWEMARADHELKRARRAEAAAEALPAFARFTEVVLIGFGLKTLQLREALDACLLSEAETAAGPELWATLPNPLFGPADDHDGVSLVGTSKA